MTKPAESKDLDAMFENDVRGIDEACDGPYGRALTALLQLAEDAAAKGAVADTDDGASASLIALVQHASQANLAQAELMERIQALGAAAVGIAMKVPGLGIRR